MESVQHIKTYKYFDVSDSDFDEFQRVFGTNDVINEDDALIYVDIMLDDMSLSRKYTDDEIKSIFDLHAEYCGIDKENAKNKVSSLSKRRKAEDELTTYVNCKIPNKRKPISIQSAKELLSILKAFDCYEFSHNN